MPVKSENNAITDKSMPRVFNDLITTANPESSCFYLEDGKRAAIFVLKQKRQYHVMTFNKNFSLLWGRKSGLLRC